MNKFMRKLEEFLSGRHGSDQLSFTLSIVGLILVFCSPAFQNDETRSLLSLLGLGLILYSVFRVFSTNDAQRRKENEAFLNFFRKFKGSGNSTKAQQRRAEKEKKKRIKEKLKTHELFYCPKCGASCFVPRGKGKVRITCPKCGEKFLGKT